MYLATWRWEQLKLDCNWRRPTSFQYKSYPGNIYVNSISHAFHWHFREFAKQMHVKYLKNMTQQRRVCQNEFWSHKVMTYVVGPATSHTAGIPFVILVIRWYGFTMMPLWPSKCIVHAVNQNINLVITMQLCTAESIYDIVHSLKLHTNEVI